MAALGGGAVSYERDTPAALSQKLTETVDSVSAFRPSECVNSPLQRLRGIRAGHPGGIYIYIYCHIYMWEIDIIWSATNFPCT